MRQLCSDLVVRVGGGWASLGWMLFVCFLFLPMVAQQFWLWIPLAIATLVWWAIDAADQSMPGWTVPFGLLLVAAGIVFLYVGWLRYFWFTTGAAWCLYWFKIRE
jgi:hypothetical protein